MSVRTSNDETPLGRIVLLRHGQTEWATTGRHTGKTDVPLTSVGEEQAVAAGELIGELSLRTPLVITSPRQRATRTAELAGLTVEREWDALSEWDYGDYEGITTAEIRKTVPDWTIWTRPCPNGETGEDVAARARRVIDRAMSVEGDVALFSHGHYLRVLTATWLELSPHHGADFALGTGTICVLGFEHEYRTIHRWNERIAGAQP